MILIFDISFGEISKHHLGCSRSLWTWFNHFIL